MNTETILSMMETGIAVSLADLRRVCQNGSDFDATILAMADAGLIQVFEDADPISHNYSYEHVRDGGHYYTAAMKR